MPAAIATGLQNEMLLGFSGEQIVLIIGIVLFSLLLPLGILCSKIFIKDGRAEVATRLAAEFPGLVNSYTFLFAVAKYVDAQLLRAMRDAPGPLQESHGGKISIIRIFKDEMPSYVLPVAAYALICFCGFYTGLVITVANPDPRVYHFDNYLIYGMHAAEHADSQKTKAASPTSAVATPAPQAEARTADTALNTAKPGDATSAATGAAVVPSAAADRRPEEDLKAYGRGTIAVSIAGFVGAYLWTLIFLARRVTNFDLSPFSFLRATIQICLACFVCVFLRHLYDSISQLVWQTTVPSGSPTPTNSSWLLALSFLIGFYPALGLNYLQERFAFLRFKTRSAATDALARELPLDMVDGIDSYIKFRLGEYEIEDIENLALANPVQLFIETPYTMRKIVDWIGQAQLLLEVEPLKVPELRNLNIRTSLDFLRFGETEEGRKILIGVLHPMQAGNVDTHVIGERLRTFAGKQHVKALQEMIDIIAGPQATASVIPIKEVPMAAG